MSSGRKIPICKGFPIIGDVPNFLGDLFNYPMQLRDRLGPVYQMRIPFYHPIFIFDPNAIRHVLEKNHQNYVKSSDYDTLKISLGEGLLTSEGEKWKRMRKTLQPYFFENVVDRFVGLMMTHSQQLVQRWMTDDVINLNAEMKRTTLDIAAEAFFGTQRESIPIDVTAVVDEMNALGVKKMRFPRNLVPVSWPTPLNRRLLALIATLDAEIYTLMQNDPEQNPNLLSLLVHNPKLSKTEIRDEIMTFLIASYETTANTLMFANALLANHPEIQSEVQAEVRKTELNPQDYKQWKTQFPLLYASIQEAMRLYPPAWMIGRRNLEDDSLAGYHLPKDSNVIIDLYAIHRLPEFWSHPDTFDPSRFATPPKEKMSYLPFGGGPRICIGQHFAMLEMVAVMHHIYRHFDIQPVDCEIVPNPLVTLGPKNPLIVRASSRPVPTKR